MFSKSAIRLRRLDTLAQAGDDTASELGETLGITFEVRALNKDGAEAWEKTWVPESDRMPPEGGWDWPAIDQATRAKTDEFCVSIWSGGTLCGLTLLKIRGNCLQVQAIEGNPDDGHPLKGRVILIVLDLAFKVAQDLNRPQVELIDPADDLVDIYVNDYDFIFELDENGRKVCKRDV